MRLIVVSREIPPVGGGAGRVALDLARHLVARGHEVHVLTMHHGRLPERESIDGVTVRRLRVGRRHQDSAYAPSMVRFVLAARREAAKLTGAQPFDLVHAHAIVPDGLVAHDVWRKHQIPYAVTAHGTDVPGYDDRRFRRAHRVLAPAWHRVVGDAAMTTTPSQYLRRLIIGRAPQANVEVIPNGIDTDAFTPRPKDPSFLIVSRLIARKNYAAFFEALATITDPVDVHVVGDGPEAPSLRTLAAATPHRVVFHGWLEHGSAEWRDLYERCRFFVFPSLAENFPVNLLEAQLAGMTVLATPVDGNQEVLGDAAIYFANASVPTIADTVRSALAMTAHDLDEIGLAGRERVTDNFSWEAVADRFVQGFNNAIGDTTDA